MMTLFVASAVLAFLLMFAPQADAKVPCRKTEDVTRLLSKTHSESVIFSAVSARGHILHVWTNPDSGEWTATIDLPNGNSCLVDTGPRHKIVKPKKGEPL